MCIARLNGLANGVREQLEGRGFGDWCTYCQGPVREHVPQAPTPSRDSDSDEHLEPDSDTIDSDRD